MTNGYCIGNYSIFIDPSVPPLTLGCVLRPHRPSVDKILNSNGLESSRIKISGFASEKNAQYIKDGELSALSIDDVIRIDDTSDTDPRTR